MKSFDPVTLPKAVGELFRLNDHSVRYSVEINGAEVDAIAATSVANPFAPTIYIEATVEYVNNDKYSKDLTKFMMFREADPRCVCLLVSSEGFSGPVRERAEKTAILTMTYEELFAKFEKISPYVDAILTNTANIDFYNNYEKPNFKDVHGEQLATEWLDSWASSFTPGQDWLIVLGEYGTGKTSLTRVLQFEWLTRYKRDPSAPIPVRIELRSFTRQFDSRALLHHFLDTNGLGHIPVDFLIHLMRHGRIILLLDGYDEMAQFLNFRERRACLAALAELSAYGAKGILTSRPNYFTEGEELKIFEALYENISKNRIYLGRSDKEYIEREQQLDTLIERYVLDRFERILRDLSPDQTTALVSRQLSGDPAGRDAVLSLLSKVFRENNLGEKTSLSGKPVIIYYLLELMDDLKGLPETAEEDTLSEWSIYKLIIDRLMLRDQQRAEISIDRRRKLLQYLAITLSKRNSSVASDEIFLELIDYEFKTDLRRMSPDERQLRRTQLFEDLRSSSTLTRSQLAGVSGWAFPHNSLREYLCVEAFVDALVRQELSNITIPVSDAMRSFVAAMPVSAVAEMISRLLSMWQNRHNAGWMGLYVTLLWDALQKYGLGEEFVSRFSSEKKNLLFDGISISNISFSNLALRGFNGQGSAFSKIGFENVDLSEADFRDSIFENCSFSDAKLRAATFERTLIIDSDFTDADVEGANFSYLDKSSTIIVSDAAGGAMTLTGDAAIGYLSFNRAITDGVSSYYRWIFHPYYPIVQKIAERLLGQRNGQYLGLTQKGESRANPAFARAFVAKLEASGLAEQDRKALVSLTAEGRQVFTDLLKAQKMHDLISEFFSNNLD